MSIGDAERGDSTLTEYMLDWIVQGVTGVEARLRKWSCK